MSNSATRNYIKTLENLKPSERCVLRAHLNQGLDQSLPGFELFTSIWWPLRKTQRVPRRRVAWLVAKLYSQATISQQHGETLPRLLGELCCRIHDEKARDRHIKEFDNLLSLDLNEVEIPLLRTLRKLLKQGIKSLDWAQLTDDLSAWENDTIHRQWVEAFANSLQHNTEEESC